MSGTYRALLQKRLQKEQPRFPPCIIYGRMVYISHNWNWRAVTPRSIEVDEVEYDIRDWLGLLYCNLSTNGTVPEEVKDRIGRLINPLQFLYFDRYKNVWNYKENCKLNLSDQTITQGFVSDMSNARGRGMMERLISGIFSSESMKVVNIGGSSLSKEPGVRSLNFKVTFECSDSSGSDSPDRLPPESPTKVSPRVCNKRENEESVCPNSKPFRFVPDIVLESSNKEHLVVKVKKGSYFNTENLSQLRYMLMPAALHQQTALGVLICTKQAVLEKCIATNGEVKFHRRVYELEDDSLVASMENLLKDIYCNVVQ